MRVRECSALTHTGTGTATRTQIHTGTALGPDYFEGRALSTVVHLFTRQATTKATAAAAAATATPTAGGGSAIRFLGFLPSFCSFFCVCFVHIFYTCTQLCMEIHKYFLYIQ